ncbi:hypothetical protein RYX36_030292, partial [Vicia faba]
TKTYENDDLKVTVVTKEINPEEENFPTERKEAAPAASPHPVVADKKKSVPLNNKKPFKKVAKHKSRPKQILILKKREVVFVIVIESESVSVYIRVKVWDGNRKGIDDYGEEEN